MFENLILDNFDYLLPEENISVFPMQNRGDSKLLQFKNNSITHHSFKEIETLLPTNSQIFFNDSRVIPARMHFVKETGGVVEIFLLKPFSHDYQQVFMQTNEVVWHCLIGNRKRWKSGSVFSTVGNLQVTAEWIDKENDHILFKWNTKESFHDVLQKLGEIPLPPYLNRKAESADNETYQTVYAKHEGAVAAPTAGLHFTPEILNKITSKGISLHYATLHVGAGTFMPVTEKLVFNHPMHHEFFRIDIMMLRALASGKTKIAVGTTTMRIIESIFWIGAKLVNEMSAPFVVAKHEPYLEALQKVPSSVALFAVEKYLVDKNIEYIWANTGIMIVPGYEFRGCDALITNFHQPQSTLIMLVAAFTNNNWLKIYSEALSNNYRFLSYGDSSLLWR